jgi:hypothetical protein
VKNGTQLVMIVTIFADDIITYYQHHKNLRSKKITAAGGQKESLFIE